MGKYMREANTTTEDHHHNLPFLGVRTRARTLALQKLHHSPPDAASFLQLRTRSLLKPPPFSPPAPACSDPSCRGPPSAGKSPSLLGSKEGPNPSPPDKGPEEAEASLGENVPEEEPAERNLRETTPCSPIVKSERALTPGLTTRSTDSYSSKKRIQVTGNWTIPSSIEIELFFEAEEQLHLRQFKEKYNFDPVTGCPMPGRYNWIRLEP